MIAIDHRTDLGDNSQLKRELHDDAEGAFAADEQLGEVVACGALAHTAGVRG